MSLPVLAILAGGLATRLGPLTRSLPKALIPVAGEPFLAHQLRLARRQGFRQVVLLTGHLGEQIEAFAQDGSRFGLEITYCSDGAQLLGTGGALQAALRHLGREVFVLYGDSYLDIEARPVYAAFKASGALAMMTVLHNRNEWDRSNVVFDGKMVRHHEKVASRQRGVEWIDFGFTVLDSSLLRNWPRPAPFDLSELTCKLAQEGSLAGFEVSSRFYEIGTLKGLADTEAYIASKSDIGT